MTSTPVLTLHEVSELLTAKPRSPYSDCVANHAGPHDHDVVDCGRPSTHLVIEHRILPDGSRPLIPMCADAAYALIDCNGWQIVSWDALRHSAY